MTTSAQTCQRDTVFFKKGHFWHLKLSQMQKTENIRQKANTFILNKAVNFGQDTFLENKDKMALR